MKSLVMATMDKTFKEKKRDYSDFKFFFSNKFYKFYMVSP